MLRYSVYNLYMSENKLLNSKQAAEKLNKSVRWIQTLIKNGRLKAEKFGRDYQILESDLQSIEERKQGRPTKLPSQLENNLWDIEGKNLCRRSMRNRNFLSRGFNILIEDGIEKYKFLYDDSKEFKRLGNTHFKKTILSELGRIENQDILLRAARHICDKKTKTADAVVWLRSIRAEYGSFDEVYKLMPDGSTVIHSTDYE